MSSAFSLESRFSYGTISTSGSCRETAPRPPAASADRRPRRRKGSGAAGSSRRRVVVPRPIVPTPPPRGRRERRAETPAPIAARARPQLLLPLDADLRHDQVARVAADSSVDSDVVSVPARPRSKARSRASHSPRAASHPSPGSARPRRSVKGLTRRAHAAGVVVEVLRSWGRARRSVTRQHTVAPVTSSTRRPRVGGSGVGRRCAASLFYVSPRVWVRARTLRSLPESSGVPHPAACATAQTR